MASAKAELVLVNDNPLRPYVSLDTDGSWETLTPRQARAFAARLLTEATKAENMYTEHKARELALRKARK